MRFTRFTPPALFLLFLLPAASAGSLEAPEVTDPAGDCEFAPGNEYGDVVAAWISDETASDFRVNLALAKWTEPIAHGAAYAVQFTHQDRQWGVAALFDQSNGGWEFSTGYVGGADDTGGFNDTEGSFTPGEPAILSLLFPKNLFPHSEAMDHELTTFWAGSVDFKPGYPFFIAQAFGAPVPAPVMAFDCDVAVGDGVYTFEVGEHSMHGMEGEGDDADAAAGEDAGSDADANSGAGDSAVEPAASNEPAAENDTPAPAVPFVLLAIGALAVARARRA